MGNSILQPKPLNEWLKLLDRTALPVHTGQKERVQRVIANPNSSLGEISRAITEAPSIALILFREASRSASSLKEPAYSLNAVLQRLGMARCSTLLASLMDESKVPIPASLRQVWLIGQHANRHANALFAHKMARLWQEIHWGSLLFFSPLWPLLTRYPEFFEHWEQRVLGNGEPAYKVERELLGLPLNRLCHALARHWNLPEWIIDGYATLGSNRRMIARALLLSRLHHAPLEQQRRLDEQKDLNTWLSQPANSIVLASGLALASHNSWGDNHCLRWQRLISLYLRLPLATVQQQNHLTSVEHARYLGITNLWHPAQALIWPWHVQRIKSEHANAAPAAQPAQPDESTRKALDLPRWRKQASTLLQRPSPFGNTLQLLNHYAGMLMHGGFSRVLVLGPQGSNGHLVPVCQLNYEFTLQEPLLDTTTNPLFRHLLKHREPLLVHTDNHYKILGHLSEQLAVRLNSRNLVMGSIWRNNKPILLAIADDWGHPLQPDSLKAFNASNRYLEQALKLR